MKYCCRCGGEGHDTPRCPWPIMMVFVVAGAAIAGCIMNIVSTR